MLTTRFEELKIGDDEYFDSFYGKLNEIVIANLNLKEKIEDAKVVKKTLRSLLESFRAKVTAIEESKDLDEIKIQELIGFSDFDSSNSDTEGECDSEGNYRAFMTIASVDSKNDLSNLVDELGDLSEDEEVEESEDEDVYQNEGENNLQEAYDSLLEDCGKYAKVANLVVKKVKKVEEGHRCILVQLKEAKCEVKGLKGKLVEAYSKIKFHFS